MGEIWGKIVGREAVFEWIVDRVASETQVWQSASSLSDETPDRDVKAGPAARPDRLLRRERDDERIATPDAVDADHRTPERPEGDDAVAVPNTMDALEWLRKHLEDDGSDLLQAMIKSFADQLMAAEADARCATARASGAGSG